MTNGLFRKTLSLKWIFFEEMQVCPSAAAGTDVLEDCHIRQAERAGTKMEARRGKIAIENGWLDSRQLARRACQMQVCMNELSDGTACSHIILKHPVPVPFIQLATGIWCATEYTSRYLRHGGLSRVFNRCPILANDTPSAPINSA